MPHHEWIGISEMSGIALQNPWGNCGIKFKFLSLKSSSISCLGQDGSSGLKIESTYDMYII